jgi:hypothetical protein
LVLINTYSTENPDADTKIIFTIQRDGQVDMALNGINIKLLLE